MRFVQPTDCVTVHSTSTMYCLFPSGGLRHGFVAAVAASITEPATITTICTASTAVIPVAAWPSTTATTTTKATAPATGKTNCFHTPAAKAARPIPTATLIATNHASTRPTSANATATTPSNRLWAGIPCCC